MGEYIVTSVKTKDGNLRDIHNRVLNSRVNILHLRVGEPCFIRYIKDGESHTMHTSNVIKFSPLNKENVIIKTMNTEYELTKVVQEVDEWIAV